MAMNQVQTELLKLIQMGKGSQDNIIKRLNDIYRKYGSVSIEKWRNMGNKKNSFLHELVEREMDEVIRYVVTEHQYDINVKRDSDGLTPLQLASENGNTKLCEILKELGGEEILTEDVSLWSPDEEKDKALNIVWIDLEMTSIKNPEIMECAVIITDKDLNTLEKANWVIHFEQSVLDTLESWHQENFADHADGGNGLFAECLKSRLTNDEVEEALLALIKRHCPKDKCPLAGSSIHTDKDVLKKCMPKVNDYLSYRIIDVSSFQAIMRRWAPWIETKIKNQVAKSGQVTVSHRAMDDIKWSISFLREFRQFLPKEHAVIQHKYGSSSNYNEESPNQFKRGSSRHDSPSNHQNRGGSSSYNRGASSIHNRGASSLYNRGASHYQGRGASNQYNGGASNSQEDEDDGDLPAANPDVNLSDLYSDEKRVLDRITLEKRVDVKDLHLSGKWQTIYYANPHLREAFLNKQNIEKFEKSFTKENRRMTEHIRQVGHVNASSKKYSTTEHWGQRKLLLTEIEFLTKYGTDDIYLVVYAGAAPSSHIPYLSSLFPTLEFILIDDKDFSIKPAGKVQIRSEKFGRLTARECVDLNRKILFICNVHTFGSPADGPNDGAEDMQNQLDWYKILKPQAALLNFRLSRPPGKTSYLKGNLIIEPWASRRSTECRLAVKKDAKMVDYDHLEFENNLFNFQNAARIMYYEHDMDDDNYEGLDHCYDCRTEIFILQEYLMKVQELKSDTQVRTGIAKMSRAISVNIVDKKRPKFINVPRTLNIIPKKVSTNL